jgi:hypothetical protein
MKTVDFKILKIIYISFRIGKQILYKTFNERKFLDLGKISDFKNTGLVIL